jgi:aminopeptidase N
VAEEQPLVSVGPGQDYIAYGKGPLAFYLLQQRIGEEAVNRALRRFVDRYRFTVAPYPRSLDLVAFLRAEAKTPEDQALITDLFERITLYDLKVDAPAAVRRPDGKWEVTVPVEARKFHADGKGAVIRMQRQPIRSGRQVLKFVTDSKPSHAGVDPYNFYVDRVGFDNVAPVA